LLKFVFAACELERLIIKFFVGLAIFLLPVLAAKLQALFGWTETPKVARSRVPVVIHLLSPAQRPLAVTADLASFWQNAYPEVRKELRGRYPKHPWPEDPLTAQAQQGTKKRPAR